MTRRLSGRLLWFLSLLLCFVASGCASTNQPQAAQHESERLEDVIPLTAANLRGHRMLYNEGWFIVTSSRKALEFARERSMQSSGEAIKRAGRQMQQRTAEYREGLASDLNQAIPRGKDRVKEGTDLTGHMFQETQTLVQAEIEYGRKTFANTWGEFIRGHLSLARRTQADRDRLAALPGEYYRSLHDDYSNVYELTTALHQKLAVPIQVSWDEAFTQAGKEFQAEYERSGQKDNALSALGPILRGYLNVLYSGAAVPAAKSLVSVGSSGAAYTASGLFLPTAGTAVVAGRTIQAAGLTVFYMGATGVHLISPTVESGFLAGMATLSLGVVPLTYVTGGTLGAINQVAFVAGAPGYTAAETAGTMAARTGTYVGFLAYDGATGASKIFINQASAGVVLGYNALTAIPAHLFMGVVDATVLLAWEGPNLVLVKVTGRVKTRDRSQLGPDSTSPADLPVGTVVDVQKLEASSEIKAEVISRDPAVIRDVLQQIPCDLKEVPDACRND